MQFKQGDGQSLLLARVTDACSPLFAHCMAFLRNSIPAGEHLPEGRRSELLACDDYRRYWLGLSGDIVGIALLYLSLLRPSPFPHDLETVPEHSLLRLGCRGIQPTCTLPAAETRSQTSLEIGLSESSR
jgi:hypothetical protein